jgi:DNA-binding transcriptional ArsR family regulator
MQAGHTPSVRVDDLLKALADPTRRFVFENLVADERSVGALTGLVDVSQPAVSQHIAVLKAAGLLSERRQGRSTLYRADPRALRPLVDWIAVQDSFWRAALGRLDETLKEMGDD